jgi:hypothetical protein
VGPARDCLAPAAIRYGNNFPDPRLGGVARGTDAAASPDRAQYAGSIKEDSMKALFAAAALFTASVAIAQDTPPTPVAPANAAPERDARGIPVVSDPATAPAGTNAPTPAGPVTINPNQSAAFATQPSTGEKPPCSRTVTDNCTQTYERHSRR